MTVNLACKNPTKSEESICCVFVEMCYQHNFRLLIKVLIAPLVVLYVMRKWKTVFISSMSEERFMLAKIRAAYYSKLVTARLVNS